MQRSQGRHGRGETSKTNRGLKSETVAETVSDSTFSWLGPRGCWISLFLSLSLSLSLRIDFAFPFEYWAPGEIEKRNVFSTGKDRASPTIAGCLEKIPDAPAHFPEIPAIAFSFFFFFFGSFVNCERGLIESNSTETILRRFPEKSFGQIFLIKFCPWVSLPWEIKKERCAVAFSRFHVESSLCVFYRKFPEEIPLETLHSRRYTRIRLAPE